MNSAPGHRWRLIPPLAASGAMQMAIDQWLLNQYQRGEHPATLRFYTWSPAAISLGYHQRSYPVHWHDLNWQGQPLELVRRPSGGRAVLHQGDLTYAIVMAGLGGQRLQTYHHICEFLRRGWQFLGYPLDYGQPGRTYQHHPGCFSSATVADLVTSTGYKLIGSAQVWQRGTVLQHGSMRLNPDAYLFRQVFGPLDQPLPDQALPPAVTVIQTLLTAACEWFQIELVPQPLSEQEWQTIQAQLQQSQLKQHQPKIPAVGGVAAQTRIP